MVFVILTSKLQFHYGHTAEYLYDASGNKRQVKHATTNQNLMVGWGSFRDVTAAQKASEKVTDYCGNVIYENGVLSMLRTAEGYITLSGATPTYHYYLRDHLGNNRVVVNQSGTVTQVNHYYPFGGVFGEGTATSTQPYKYNDKELDRTNGFDLYDYSARFMDAALGQFTTVDPLAEKYYSISPYVYVGNNPVKFIDPDGKDTYRYDIIRRELSWISDEGGKEKQFVDFYNEKNVLINSAYVNGKDVFVYGLKDNQFVMTNFDAKLNEREYNTKSGYEYSFDDFVMRNELLKGENPIGKYILQTEREGNAQPITRRDAENTYGSSMLSLLTLVAAMDAAIGITDGGIANKYASKGFNLKRNPTIKSLEPQSSTNSWNSFLKNNKGKYKGSDWYKKALEDYKKYNQHAK